jgi:hypothetical protein
VFALGLAACSPALNWRDVSVGDLTGVLPCKPDTAQREVQLGELRGPLSMAGCEAAGTLFAISTLQNIDASRAEQVVFVWKNRTIQRMVATETEVWKPAPSAQSLQIILALKAVGKNENGAQVHARLLWLRSKDALFHIAAYGPRLEDDTLDMFTSQLRLEAGATP